MVTNTDTVRCLFSNSNCLYILFQASLKRNLELLYEKFIEKRNVLLPHNPGYEVSGLEINVSQNRCTNVQKYMYSQFISLAYVYFRFCKFHIFSLTHKTKLVNKQIEVNN